MELLLLMLLEGFQMLFRQYFKYQFFSIQSPHIAEFGELKSPILQRGKLIDRVTKPCWTRSSSTHVKGKHTHAEEAGKHIPARADQEHFWIIVHKYLWWWVAALQRDRSGKGLLQEGGQKKHWERVGISSHARGQRESRNSKRTKTIWGR